MVFTPERLTEVTKTPEQLHRGNQLWVFPGQGNLEVGLGLEEYQTSSLAKNLINRMDILIGGPTPFSDLLFNGPLDILQRSENAHLALVMGGVAKISAGIEKGTITKEPRFILGASAGAIPALYAAGVLSLEDTIKVAKMRGSLTQDASDGKDVKMATIIGNGGQGDRYLETMVREAIRDAKIDRWEKTNSHAVLALSGIYSPDAIGISGDRVMVDSVEEILKDKIKLFSRQNGISIVSHSPYMKDAAEMLRVFLEGIDFHDPLHPLIMNGEIVTSAVEARKRLPQELLDPVLYMKSTKLAASLGADEVIEFTTTAPKNGKPKREIWSRFGKESVKDDYPDFKTTVL